MRTRWEYTCISSTESSLNYSHLVEVLNEMGKEGWELIAVSSPLATLTRTSAENRLTYWMKRPLE